MTPKIQPLPATVALLLGLSTWPFAAGAQTPNPPHTPAASQPTPAPAAGEAGSAPAQPAPATSPAPDPKASPKPAPDPRDQAIAELKEKVASLQDEVDLMQAFSDDEEAPPQTTFPTLLNALNPRLTVFGDALGRLDTRRLQEGGERIDDHFVLRETEIDLRASADPFVDGVVILSFEGLSGGRFEPTIEEAYANIKRLNLPVLHDPPLGLSFKVGHFRAGFGRLNQTHTHDLPQTDRPLAMAVALGEDGMAGSGISARGFLPLEWLDDASTLIFTVEALDASVPASPHQTHAVAMLDWSRPFGPSHRLELTLMGTWGRTLREDLGPDDRTLAANLFYQWRPAGASLHRSFILSLGVLSADRPLATNDHILGLWGFAQAQLSREFFLGVRVDRSPTFESTTQTLGVYPYVSWYPSEFFRLRLGWRHLIPDEGPDTGTFLCQLDFIFGSHPPEPYWVSR